MKQSQYPVRFQVDYPDRPLNRMTTLFRLFMLIPIGIVLSAIAGGSSSSTWTDPDTQKTITTVVVSGGGLVVGATVLMIVFRQKYPRWWFDWNLELQRFTNRVGIYGALMNDQYPSTDEAQSVHLDWDYPDVSRDLNRFLPLVKWLLAIPHYIVLFFLHIAMFFAVIVAWFAILFTGRYPRGIFGFVEGVLRWDARVIGYAMTMVTDQYPPFSLD
ncbi:MAG: DUF4389 domain-containing protein [Thermomicrobiales bacterium]